MVCQIWRLLTEIWDLRWWRRRSECFMQDCTLRNTSSCNSNPSISTIIRKIKWSQLQNNLMFLFHHLLFFALTLRTNYFWDAWCRYQPSTRLSFQFWSISFDKESFFCGIRPKWEVCLSNSLVNVTLQLVPPFCRFCRISHVCMHVTGMPFYMFFIIWLFRPCKLWFLKAYHPSTPTTLTTLNKNHPLL